VTGRLRRRCASRALAAGCALATVAGAIAPPTDGASAATASVQSAYSFLNRTMDLYAGGTTPRLVQSFTGGSLGQQGFTDSETYDDALMIDAYLAEATPDGLGRAQTLGKALLLVQAHDPAHDGRVRAAYAPTPLVSVTRRGRVHVKVRVRDKTTDVGTMAWVGMALARLYAQTGDPSYLTGAQSIAGWVVQNCRDGRGPGGYSGGRTASGAPIRWKSTEHNIDLFGLFTMLGTETGAAQWSGAAAWAKTFVTAMWDPPTGSFFVGTTADGVTPNLAEQPEDVNSWSYLALLDPTFGASVDWDVQHLSVSVGGFSGVSFCLGDRTGVWFEGTAHLADALALRNAPGDAALAGQYLADIQAAQASGPNADGLGVPAASKDGLSDCDGGTYDASLHTGATAWYVLAAMQVDPLHI